MQVGTYYKLTNYVGNFAITKAERFLNYDSV